MEQRSIEDSDGRVLFVGVTIRKKREKKQDRYDYLKWLFAPVGSVLEKPRSTARTNLRAAIYVSELPKRVTGDFLTLSFRFSNPRRNFASFG
jgi:hypothetical protein